MVISIQWDSVKIEKDVDIPVVEKPSPALDFLDKLEVNDSFELPVKSFPTVRALIARYRKTRSKNRQFVIRKIDNTVRCWRVK